MRILLIDDNELYGDVVKKYLLQEGYTVDWLKDAKAANAILQTDEYFDLAITDLEVNGWSWQQWAQAFKEKNPTVPILMLTGFSASIIGLKISADTCLFKYQTDREKLLSSVRMLLRRSAAAKAADDSVLRYKHITLDIKSRALQVQGEPVDITRREFTLLHKLLTHIGRVIPRNELLQSLYGWETEIDSNALDVHIYNLRRKLNIDSIKSVRGVGYIVENETTE